MRYPPRGPFSRVRPEWLFPPPPCVEGAFFTPSRRRARGLLLEGYRSAMFSTYTPLLCRHLQRLWQGVSWRAEELPFPVPSWEREYWRRSILFFLPPPFPRYFSRFSDDPAGVLCLWLDFMVAHVFCVCFRVEAILLPPA